MDKELPVLFDTGVGFFLGLGLGSGIAFLRALAFAIASVDKELPTSLLPSFDFSLGVADVSAPALTLARTLVAYSLPSLRSLFISTCDIRPYGPPFAPGIFFVSGILIAWSILIKLAFLIFGLAASSACKVTPCFFAI